MQSEYGKVDVQRVGNLVVFSSGEFAILKKVLAYIEAEGGRTLRRPHKVRGKWIASAYVASRTHDNLRKAELLQQSR